MYEALRKGADVQTLHERTHIKAWFIEQMKELVDLEEEILKHAGAALPDALLTRAKKDGFADRYLAKLLGVAETEIREHRKRFGPARRLASGAGQRRRERGLLLQQLQRQGRDRGLRESQDHGPRRRPPTASGKGSSSTTAAFTPRSPCGTKTTKSIMVNCNPRNRLDRLRYVQQTLLRAAHGRGRAEHLREGEARGRGRPVWRPDASEHRGRIGRGGREYHRHLARHDRTGRGPRSVPKK